LALPGADDPPVLLWAVGGVRLMVDGAAAYSSPDEPKHLSVGDHILRAEAEGLEPLEIRFHVEPFVPALLHVQADEGVGLSVAFVGVTCRSCEFANVVPSLDPEPREMPVKELLPGAAASLRRSDWRRAAGYLRQVPASERKRPPFTRLAASFYASTLQDEKARAALASIPAAKANDLGRLMDALGRLEKSERARRAQVLLARWNKLAERFAALSGRFQGDAPGPVTAHSKRFEGLSLAFNTAVRDDRLPGQQRAVEGAEATVRALAADIRAARPNDCGFQKDVLGALVR
jgi:hypothetical protein